MDVDDEWQRLLSRLLGEIKIELLRVIPTRDVSDIALHLDARWQCEWLGRLCQCGAGKQREGEDDEQWFHADEMVLCELVTVRPLGTRRWACEAGVGFFVADEALRLGVELKIDIQILGDGSEIEHLRESA